MVCCQLRYCAQVDAMQQERSIHFPPICSVPPFTKSSTFLHSVVKACPHSVAEVARESQPHVPSYRGSSVRTEGSKGKRNFRSVQLKQASTEKRKRCACCAKNVSSISTAGEAGVSLSRAVES